MSTSNSVSSASSSSSFTSHSSQSPNSTQPMSGTTSSSSPSPTIPISTRSTSSFSTISSSTSSSPSTSLSSPSPSSPSSSSPSSSSPSSTSPSPTSPSSTTLSTNPPSSSSGTPFPTSSSTSSTTTLIRPSTSRGSRTGVGTSTSTQGQLATPSAITSLLTSTASNGGLTTVTQVNPTLSAENSSGKGSAFFHNTGAIVGVFTLVGLAAATIFLWIFFAVRRRRRTRQLEHDTAVSATLAAAGFNRTPLDDDGNDHGSVSRRSRFGSPDVDMGQRPSSGLATGMNSRPPSGLFESRDREDTADTDFNPYFDYIVQPGAHPGYAHVRTGSSPHHHPGLEHANHGHTASHSAGSYEPLLASYYRTGPGSPSSPTVAVPNDVPPTPPPRNPQRLVDIQSPDDVEVNRSAASSLYSSESTGDDRLDPLLRKRLAEGETKGITTRDPRDEEDYSRPVLGVRNMSGGTSTEST